MSSTLTVTNLTATNLTDGGSTTSTFADINKGRSQCWVNFTGTSTVTIEDSLNTSSITDNSTGRYEANQTNNFANANYCITHNGLLAAGNGWFASYFDKTTANVELLFITTLGAYADCADVSVTYNGVLA